MIYRQTSRVSTSVHLFFTSYVFILLIFPLPAFAEKTDIVVLRNGDRVTGSIKELKLGQLRLSTDAMGMVMIDWDTVETIISDKTIQVQLVSGKRVMGTLEQTMESEGLQVRSGNIENSIPTSQIVGMESVAKSDSLWKRLDGSISFGMDYAKSTRIAQSYMSAGAILREEKYTIDADFNYNINRGWGGSSDVSTERFFLGGAYKRKLPDRWFWLVNSNVERNEQIGLDFRSLVGGGAGRAIWQTNWFEFSLFGGAAASRENKTDEEVNSVEGQFGSSLSIYRFSPTRTSLNTSLLLYPSISDSGRWRANYRMQLRWELYKDLFWDMSYYYTFDNEPPAGASREDTGINTGIGLLF